MNPSLAIAAALTFLLGLAHSVVGERLVFRRGPVGGRSAGIVRASWHALTAFGWALGALMVEGALDGALSGVSRVALPMAVGLAALLVLAGTRGRHPGWIVLSVIALLVWLA